MPTNLPPDYYQIEARYKAATDPQEKARLLQEMMSTIPKHKGTDKLRADLRKRLSQLKEEPQTRKGAARQVSPYVIDREGAGQIVLVGMPNVGKSALVETLTNATPEVSEVPYSTWGPTPGMMLVGGVQIQLIDTPPLNPEFIDSEMLNLIRRADLVLLVVDVQGYPIEQLEKALALLKEHGIVPDFAPTQEASRALRVPSEVIVNKVDDGEIEEDFAVLKELVDIDSPMIPVSAETGRNLDALKWHIFKLLEIIRVYSKPPGKEADLTAPFVRPIGTTVEDFAGQVHQDFREKLKGARVWGSAQYDGQMVARDYVLHDGDRIELHI